MSMWKRIYEEQDYFLKVHGYIPDYIIINPYTRAQLRKESERAGDIPVYLDEDKEMFNGSELLIRGNDYNSIPLIKCIKDFERR